ncbi:MAG: dipeptidase [Acidobacteriota bacterium]
MRYRTLTALALLAALVSGTTAADAPSREALAAAEHARATYGAATEEALGRLVTFRTFKEEGVENADNPEVHGMSEYLAAKAEELGLEFEDHGAVAIIALGKGKGPAKRLGIVTHGDVQPADPGEWAKDPFVLDTESDPGKLIARGTEDDKGPIATALYAMKTLKDLDVPLDRRIELIVSYTEESDWTPYREFLAGWEPPALNVVIDASYPVVVAEKGWGSIHLTPAAPEPEVAAPGEEATPAGPRLESITGGAFLSQIPGRAEAVILGPVPGLVGVLGDRLRVRQAAGADVEIEMKGETDKLTLRAKGVAAHSSTPWNGKNAITHLAAILDNIPWQETQATRTVRLINDLVGLGDEAEKFGDLAYAHDFMGPLTLSLTTLEANDEGLLTAGINIRRPAGRSNEEVEGAIRDAVNAWSEEWKIPVAMEMRIGEPYYPQGAPQVPVLLSVFEHFTGQENPQPLSIGGGTHARLMPNGVNFGPSMPGEVYTGHTEHEFLTREQLLLNLEMYTAMLVELAGR